MERLTEAAKRVKLPDYARDLFSPYRYKVLYGGRGGGKTETVCRVLLLKAAMERLNIMCGREFQNSLDESVKPTLEAAISEMGLDYFYRVYGNEISGINGSHFGFKGLARNVESVKGWNDVDIFWGEEANVISDESLRLLKPTIRKPNSELWFTFNRKDRDDPIDKMFLGENKPARTFVKKVNFYDNPFFPDILEEERQNTLLLEPERYDHIWLGEPDEVAGIFFKSEWIKYYDKLPETLSIYGASDYALTEGGGDWTVHGVFGVDKEDNIYLLDWWRAQTESLTWVEQLLHMARLWQPMYWFEEGGSIIKALDPLIKKMMLDTKTYFVRQNFNYGGKNKEARAQGVRARMAMGKVFFPRNAAYLHDLITEMMRFPEGKHDDQVDVLSLVGLGLGSIYTPPAPQAVQAKAASDYGINDDDEDNAWSCV